MSADSSIAMVYVAPPSPAYSADKLFDVSNPVLNRDDSLLPYALVKEEYARAGIEMHTGDLLPAKPAAMKCDYYSLGMLDGIQELKKRDDVNLRAFVIFEPPVVEPRLYHALPELTAAFNQVYVHNVHGDGYAMDGVDASRLRKLYWPQPRHDVILDYWERRERQRRIVVINGNHVPRKVPNELYSKRIEAMAALASTGKIDLYGRGWERWWSRASMWWPYWRNRRALMSIYRGACASKYEVLASYDFSLCFENMAMQGYVTEKIFDCFYAGTIPLYLGASDIENLVPRDAYIDCRKFTNWHDMLNYVENLPQDIISSMREQGRAFIRGAGGAKHRESLLDVFGLQEERKE
jgi:hypothetical protein